MKTFVAYLYTYNRLNKKSFRNPTMTWNRLFWLVKPNWRAVVRPPSCWPLPLPNDHSGTVSRFWPLTPPSITTRHWSESPPLGLHRVKSVESQTCDNWNRFPFFCLFLPFNLQVYWNFLIIAKFLGELEKLSPTVGWVDNWRKFYLL